MYDVNYGNSAAESPAMAAARHALAQADAFDCCTASDRDMAYLIGLMRESLRLVVDAS